MGPSNEIERLLTEIRDVEREHLEEYKRVTGQLMEMQASAIEMQRGATKLHAVIAWQRLVIFVLGATLLALGLYVVFRG